MTYKELRYALAARTVTPSDAEVIQAFLDALLGDPNWPSLRQDNERLIVDMVVGRLREKSL